MNHHPQRCRVVRWILSIILPIVAAATAFLWLGLTSAAGACVSGPASPGWPGLMILVAAAPACICSYVWQSTGSTTKAWLPMFVSVVLAIPLVVFAVFLWSAGHNCFE